MSNTPTDKTGAAKAEPKMKYRWKFCFADMAAFIPAEKAKRPSVKWNEVVLKKGHDKAYFASDIVWEPITITFYDTESSPSSLQELLDYMAKYNPTNSERSGNYEFEFVGTNQNPPKIYKSIAYLDMLNSAGDSIEKWTLHGAWITNFVFGEVSYLASDIAKIDVTVRFDRASVKIEGGRKTFSPGRTEGSHETGEF